MTAGRPTDYNINIAHEICDKIATCAIGLKQLCREHSHWPHPDTIYLWLRKHREFSDLYARAKKDQVTALVEEIIEIADDGSRDDKYNDNGEVSCNSEWVARSRLRVDTRKWIAAKLVPRLYGDNMLARELADEMEEFKKLLDSKNIRKLNSDETNSGEAEEDTQE